MITEKQIRYRILKKIYRVPIEKLEELDEFISKLELKANNKSKTLQFAGSWSEIDNLTFKHFTSDLINNRQKNKRRIDE